MSHSPFTPFKRRRDRQRLRRFRTVPVRVLVPNLITLLALCAGLTAIRFAVEGKLEWSLGAIVFAAVLDGIDGRVARLLKGTSRFGAELDSLADFVNFGVAPALILYFWTLHDLKSAGWIAALVFAIAAGLRLARFNVMIDDPNRPAWAGNFFVGMPAPAGAITVLLPVYMHFLDVPQVTVIPQVTFVYTLAIAFLMVSRLPVYSGKRLGTRVPPDLVLHRLHRRRAVLRAVDQLPLGGADHRHHRLSREPAVRRSVLSGAHPARCAGGRRRAIRQRRDAGASAARRAVRRQARRRARDGERPTPSLKPDHPMPRTQKVVRPGETKGDIIDTVLLKYEDRIKQQGFVFGGKGTCVEFDFPAPPLLRTDDLLVLDDGRLIEVVAEVEPVLEVREKDFAKARAAGPRARQPPRAGANSRQPPARPRDAGGRAPFARNADSSRRR